MTDNIFVDVSNWREIESDDEHVPLKWNNLETLHELRVRKASDPFDREALVVEMRQFDAEEEQYGPWRVEYQGKTLSEAVTQARKVAVEHNE